MDQFHGLLKLELKVCHTFIGKSTGQGRGQGPKDIDVTRCEALQGTAKQALPKIVCFCPKNWAVNFPRVLDWSVEFRSAWLPDSNNWNLHQNSSQIVSVHIKTSYCMCACVKNIFTHTHGMQSACIVVLPTIVNVISCWLASSVYINLEIDKSTTSDICKYIWSEWRTWGNVKLNAYWNECKYTWNPKKWPLVW